MAERQTENALNRDERIELAERIRLAFDTPPEVRAIQDTWLYAAATAEQFFVERAHWLRTRAVSTSPKGSS